MIFFMPLPLMFTPLPMIQPYIKLLPSSASLPLMLVLNLVLLCLQLSTQILVKFNTSKTQLLTISLSNTPSNYPITFEGSEIPPPNSINILGLQISSSLSCRDHIVQIAKSASKSCGFSFDVNSILILLNYSNCILVLFVPAWNIALISGVLPLISLILDSVESKAIRLIDDPSLTSTLDPFVSLPQGSFSVSFPPLLLWSLL